MKGVMLFLFVGIFMLGVVSADVNLAASSNGATVSLVSGSGGVQGLLASISDENTGTYYGRRCSATDADGDVACTSYFTIDIDLQQSSNIKNMNYNIYYDATFCEVFFSCQRECDISIHQPSGWTQVVSNAQSSGSISAVGDGWEDVDTIRVYMRSWCEYDSGMSGDSTVTATARLLEIEAWGPEPSSSISLPTNTCSFPNQTIMKLYQPTNSHGALFDQGYIWDIWK